jgi:hypothetical protein
VLLATLIAEAGAGRNRAPRLSANGSLRRRLCRMGPFCWCSTFHRDRRSSRGRWTCRQAAQRVAGS